MEYSDHARTEASYVKVNHAQVAYTLEIVDDDERFLADYDASGAVRGVEFLGSHRKPVDHYRSVAARHATAAGPRGPREKRP